MRLRSSFQNKDSARASSVDGMSRPSALAVEVDLQHILGRCLHRPRMDGGEKSERGIVLAQTDPKCGKVFRSRSSMIARCYPLHSEAV